jgi:NADH-quinone oxidoreductase subunit E
VITDKKAQLLDILPQEVKLQIDESLKKFPLDKKRSALLDALMFAQEHNNGYLTNELIESVACYLEQPVISAYEVATFYSMYELNPVGKYHINIFTNVSCMLKGAEDIVEYLKKKLKIDVNEVTQDGKFSLKIVECLGACVHAPMLLVNKKYYENLTYEKIDQLIKELK